MTATLTLPAGKTRKLAARRARIQDDVTADYLAMVVKPGDRTMQIGASDLGAVCLQRGARHEIVAPVAAIESLQAVCERRGIPTDALRGGLAARPGAAERPIDVAIFGAETGFPAMAANWRHVSSSMRQGGVLILMGANRGGRCASRRRAGHGRGLGTAGTALRRRGRVPQGHACRYRPHHDVAVGCRAAGPPCPRGQPVPVCRPV